MRYRIDLKELQEDLRKLGLALIIAGVVGGVVQPIPLGDAMYAILLGAGFNALGLLR